MSDGVEQCFATATGHPFNCASPAADLAPETVATLLTEPAVSVRVSPRAGVIDYVTTPDVAEVEIAYDGQSYSVTGGIAELQVDAAPQADLPVISGRTDDGRPARVYDGGCMTPDEGEELPVVGSSNC